MSEEQPPLKRVRLNEESLMEMKREDLLHRWKQQEDYVNYLESKASHSSDDDSEEKLRQMHAEFNRKEKIHILRLSTKEQEFQELANKLAEISKGQSPGASQLRSTLLDPALNLLFQRMKKELEDKNKQLQQAQEDMSAWKFTSDSQTGKRLMARCRTLLQENQDLGKQVSSGKIATLDAELAMQKKYNEELKGSQDELYEMVVQLNEEGEGMQSTICALQQQLKDVTSKLSKYEVVNPSAAPNKNNLVRVSNEPMRNVERTENPTMDDRTDNSQKATDSEPLEKYINSKAEDRCIGPANEDGPSDSLKGGPEEPRGTPDEIVNSAPGHENDERTPTTGPSNNDAHRLESETRTSLEGPGEQYAKPQEDANPLRTTGGHVDDRTPPVVEEKGEEPKGEPMDTTTKKDDGVDGGGGGRTTKPLATEEMQLDAGENQTTATPEGEDDGDDERTPPTKARDCQPGTQPLPCEGEEMDVGADGADVTEAADPAGGTPTPGKGDPPTLGEGDHAGLDFRTTNDVMTPASPPEQTASAGDVDMAEPIRDHLEDKDRTESAVLGDDDDDRTKNRTEEEDPLEKMEVIGKDEKSLNQNIGRDVKNDEVDHDKSMEEESKPAENMEEIGGKLNCGENSKNDDENLQSGNIDDKVVKNVVAAGSEESGGCNCLGEKDDAHCVASNPVSPENNGEVVTSTPMSPQSTDNESEPGNPGSAVDPERERCQQPLQVGAVSNNLLKTTNGVQKGIISKDGTTALPTTVQSPQEEDCTSDAQSKERTNGPTGQEEGDMPVRTDPPKGGANVTAE